MGAALEMVHTYSLIHDDLPCMDNDDFRRGKPTNHKVYGEATAVLAGDSLLTEAFSLLSNGTEGQEKRYMNAIGILSESAGALGMAGGQQMDLAGESAPLTREEHTEMTLRKTGELIRAACLLGCAASDADTEKRMAAEKYAYGIGLSFQIIDDILDAGTEDGKTTFLTFYTEDEAKALARELTDSAINAIKGYGGSDTLIALAEYLHSRKI
jgi:geranylgeranyl diphosphate synthase type II